MHEPCQIKLDDNSRLHLALTKSGALSVQLLRPGCDRDGHGLFVVAATLLSGEELSALLATLTPPEFRSRRAREIIGIWNGDKMARSGVYDGDRARHKMAGIGTLRQPTAARKSEPTLWRP